MADPPNTSSHERVIRPQDPAVEFEDTNHEEPQDEDGSDKEYLEKHGELSTHRNSVETAGGEKEYMEISGDPSSQSSDGDLNREKRPEIKQTKSYATTTSALSRTESTQTQQIVQKPWYKQPNPLRWGKIPPVPEVRTPSREHTASFFSLVYFQWMAPIMNVSFPQCAVIIMFLLTNLGWLSTTIGTK
jgi:ATP-binding cassette subfamily C (CFTR/MRP) protein 1